MKSLLTAASLALVLTLSSTTAFAERQSVILAEGTASTAGEDLSNLFNTPARIWGKDPTLIPGIDDLDGPYIPRCPENSRCITPSFTVGDISVNENGYFVLSTFASFADLYAGESVEHIVFDFQNSFVTYLGAYRGAEGGGERVSLAQLYQEGAFYEKLDDKGNFTLSWLTDRRITNVELTYALTSSVPEPETWAMLMVGFGVVSVVARKRRTHT